MTKKSESHNKDVELRSYSAQRLIKEHKQIKEGYNGKMLTKVVVDSEVNSETSDQGSYENSAPSSKKVDRGASDNKDS